MVISPMIEASQFHQFFDAPTSGKFMILSRQIHERSGVPHGNSDFEVISSGAANYLIDLLRGDGVTDARNCDRICAAIDFLRMARVVAAEDILIEVLVKMANFTNSQVGQYAAYAMYDLGLDNEKKVSALIRPFLRMLMVRAMSQIDAKLFTGAF